MYLSQSTSAKLIFMNNKIFLIVLCILSVLPTGHGLPFQQNPIFNIKIGSNTASQPESLEIASDQSMILVGLANGSISTYTVNGTFLQQINTNFGIIFQIQWITGFGFLAYGGQGYVGVYNTTGSLLYKTFVGNASLVNEVLVSSTSAGKFMTIVTQTQIQEYNITNISCNSNRNFNLPPNSPNGTQFFSAFYSSDIQYLFATTNQGQLVAYSRATGETVGSPLKTTDNSNFQTVAPFVGGSYVLTDYLGLLYSFSFTSLGFTNQQFIANMQAYSSYADSQMLTFYSSLIGISNLNTSSYVNGFNIYNSTFGLLQTLTYFTAPVATFAFSGQYLVTLDNNSYLAATSYNLPPPNPAVYAGTLSNWLLGVIIGCGALLLIVIIVVIIICCRRRRRRLQEHLVKDSFFQDDANIYEANFGPDSSKSNTRRVSELQNIEGQNYRQKPNGNQYDINRTVHD